MLDNINHLHCRPKLVRLSSNLTAAQFDLMKMVPARKIILDAMDQGRLIQGGHVVESSSGTFALALAILSSALDFRLTLVTGPLDSALKWRLTQLGAQLEIVPDGIGYQGGIQQKRLDRLADILRDDPSAFWPQQYENPSNPASYSDLAALFQLEVGDVDILVATVGSGGSISGTSRYLRAAGRALEVHAVDHNLSVLFGSSPASVQSLCHECYEPLLGMGADIVIGNLDHTQCDVVHWVPVALMINAVHKLHRETGLLVGPTAGAAYVVADWLARENPTKTVVTIFPDHGIRYLSSVFSADWLQPRAGMLTYQQSAPVNVDHPTGVDGRWCSFDWARRSYVDVLGYPPRPKGA
ncbi:pyridoxal-phosphate dependent enzyme [Tabrizicola piscis]|nr:pyridoxal-phosphate dependent enzyme [Tabrizicola piscis]